MVVIRLARGGSPRSAPSSTSLLRIPVIAVTVVLSNAWATTTRWLPAKA